MSNDLIVILEDLRAKISRLMDLTRTIADNNLSAENDEDKNTVKYQLEQCERYLDEADSTIWTLLK